MSEFDSEAEAFFETEATKSVAADTYELGRVSAKMFLEDRGIGLDASACLVHPFAPLEEMLQVQREYQEQHPGTTTDESLAWLKQQFDVREQIYLNEMLFGSMWSEVHQSRLMVDPVLVQGIKHRRHARLLSEAKEPAWIDFLDKYMAGELLAPEDVESEVQKARVRTEAVSTALALEKKRHQADIQEAAYVCGISLDLAPDNLKNALFELSDRAFWTLVGDPGVILMKSNDLISDFRDLLEQEDVSIGSWIALAQAIIDLRKPKEQ